MIRFDQLLFAVVIPITLAGCHGVAVTHRPSDPVVVHRPGPPPHAPAHGHRHEHRSGVELHFDAELGVYVVARHTDVYFHDGWFIRIRGGVWQTSTALSGPWKPKAKAWVPPGLRAKHHAKKSRGRGRGAAKGAW